MDREIPKEVRNKERNKKIIRYGGMGAAGIVVISVLISLMRTGVKEKDLVFSKVNQGTIEVSVSASGKVVPAFEEIINSPINTRILEVYKKGGDSVDVGTPILKLDLQSAETDYKQKLDEEQMRSYKKLYRRNRDLAIILTAAFYLLNVMDAHVDAHMKDFDVSGDLAWRLQPTVEPLYAMGGYNYAVGLGLSLTF